MKDHGISLNSHCPCSQPECPIRGNCVLCVQNHLAHKRHIPECIQNILRPHIQSLAAQVEFDTRDVRPGPGYWQSVDKEDFLRQSKGRHGKHDGKEPRKKKDVPSRS